MDGYGCAELAGYVHGPAGAGVVACARLRGHAGSHCAELDVISPAGGERRCGYLWWDDGDEDAAGGFAMRGCRVGVADVARRLGVSRPRVWQLRRRPDFPVPAGRRGNRDYWYEDTILRWAAATGREVTG